MITFIVPSIGRPTLAETVQSINTQTSPQWEAIIVFDGVKPITDIASSPKIQILEITKKGEGTNSAGNVRNEGMRNVNTDWIAFVDDDDVISPDFVDTFQREIIDHPYVDVLIFRMYQHKQRIILPKLNTHKLIRDQVGISFVIRTNIFKSGFKFIPSPREDFEYLDTLRNNGYKLMISPYVRYFVDGGVDTDAHDKVGNRVFVGCYLTYAAGLARTPMFVTIRAVLLIVILFTTFIVLLILTLKQHNYITST